MISIYGDNKKSRELIHHILQTGKMQNRGQIKSFIRTAVTNKKNADMHMVRQLQKLGLKIEVHQDTIEEVSKKEMSRAEHTLKNSNYIFKQVQPDHIVHLDKKDNVFIN